MGLYERMMGRQGQVSGPIQIGRPIEIGDPAAQGAVPTALYAEGDYTNEDEIDVGVFDGVSIAANTGHTIQTTVQNPFKPLGFCVPSWQAPGLQLTQITIASVNLIDGGPVPADMYVENSTLNDVRWPTMQTSGRIDVTIFNNSNGAVTPNCGIKGKRLR